ncbi:MAG: TlpA disulfide reductase family protein [Actinomycetota bacterium]
MNARYIPVLALCLALLAPACGGKAGAETAGQTIKAATSYRLSTYEIGHRRTPKAWSGPNLVTGATIRSADLRGSVTVVNFWASWCGPCRDEQAELERLYKEYASRGVRFIGINIRDARVDARSYLEEFGVTYPSIRNQDASIAAKFRSILFIPSTAVLDRRGRIAARISGVTVERDLRSVLDAELAS